MATFRWSCGHSRPRALDFIEKPANPESVIDAVQRACTLNCETRVEIAMRTHFHDALATQTTQEREVMDHMATGISNKVIAGEIRISE